MKFTRIAYQLENYEVFSMFSSLLVGEAENEAVTESVAVILAVAALQEVSKKGTLTAEQKEGMPKQRVETNLQGDSWCKRVCLCVVRSVGQGRSIISQATHSVFQTAACQCRSDHGCCPPTLVHRPTHLLFHHIPRPRRVQALADPPTGNQGEIT